MHSEICAQTFWVPTRLFCLSLACTTRVTQAIEATQGHSSNSMSECSQVLVCFHLASVLAKNTIPSTYIDSELNIFPGFQVLVHHALHEVPLIKVYILTPFMINFHTALQCGAQCFYWDSITSNLCLLEKPRLGNARQDYQTML